MNLKILILIVTTLIGLSMEDQNFEGFNRGAVPEQPSSLSLSESKYEKRKPSKILASIGEYYYYYYYDSKPEDADRANFEDNHYGDYGGCDGDEYLYYDSYDDSSEEPSSSSSST